jgi:hypothetical protein
MMNLALRESVGAFAVPALFAPDAAAVVELSEH